MPQKIENKYLDRGDLFALKYSNGLVFFSVEGYSEPRYQPFTNLDRIDPETSLSSSFQRLEDAQRDDVLYLETDSSSHRILHVGIGQKPSFIRRYTRYPESGPKMSSFPNLSVPNVGDNTAYVDGDESPYGQPTDARELVIPPGFHLVFNFHNPHPSKTASPTLDIKTRLYDVDVLNPRGTQSEKQAIRNIIRPGSAPPIYPVGTIDSQEDFNMQGEWAVSPMSRAQLSEVL